MNKTNEYVIENDSTKMRTEEILYFNEPLLCRMIRLSKVDKNPSFLFVLLSVNVGIRKNFTEVEIIQFSYGCHDISRTHRSRCELAGLFA